MNALDLLAQTPSRRVPLQPDDLRQGDRLNSLEFTRRYEAMPALKEAELIEGIGSIISSPVRYDAC